MGTWMMSADLLARARFVVSPYADVVAALAGLTDPRTPTERALAAQHGDAFRAMLDRHPGRGAVLAHSFRPVGPPTTCASRPVVARCPSRTTWTCWWGVGTGRSAPTCWRRPAARCRGCCAAPASRRYAAGLLDWVWVHVVATDWPRRERVLRADIVARTSRLASHGWEAVLTDLGRDRVWLGGGELQINVHDNPPATSAGRASSGSCPSTGRRARWAGELPSRYAVFYPVAGVLAGLESGRPGAAAPAARP